MKYDDSLKNGKILKEGTVTNPISVPVFYYSNESKKLYAIAIDENIKITNNNVTEKKQILNIYLIDGNSITSIKEYNGDVIEQNRYNVM